MRYAALHLSNQCLGVLVKQASPVLSLGSRWFCAFFGFFKGQAPIWYTYLSAQQRAWARVHRRTRMASAESQSPNSSRASTNSTSRPRSTGTCCCGVAHPDQDFSVLETPRACQAQDALHCAPQNELGGELPQNAAAAPDRKACGMESHHLGEDLWQHGFKLQEALFALVTFEPTRERRCKLLCLSAPYARSPPLSLSLSLSSFSLFSVCLSVCLFFCI